jgi:hypothetical protein
VTALRLANLPLWDRIVDAIEEPEYQWPQDRPDSQLAADRILELLDARGMLNGSSW